MDYYLGVNKQCLIEARAGLPVCVITESDKNLMPAWCDAARYFTICYDADTSGLPFVFEACLVDEDTRVCESYSVYVVCMEYFAWDKPDARGIRFGAISAVGRSDKFSPERIIKIAREVQAHAQKILAEVKRI